jgi:DNA-binding transcriptional ArsR family regulator
MRTLADPTRRAIYERIAAEPDATVVSLTKHALVSQPAVSQHIKVMLDARIIQGRREGRNTFYRVDPRGLVPLTEWLNYHKQMWHRHFDRLDAYLLETHESEKEL